MTGFRSVWVWVLDLTLEIGIPDGLNTVQNRKIQGFPGAREPFVLEPGIISYKLAHCFIRTARITVSGQSAVRDPQTRSSPSPALQLLVCTFS